MDSSIEFLDLSDVEEKEKLWILNFLHSWDENVQVPWKKTNQTIKSSEGVPNSLQELHYSTNNVLPEKIIPYHNQPIYQNVIYHGPAETSMNVTDYFPHIQQVRPNSVANNDENFCVNSTPEQANVHHINRHITEQNTSQSSNNHVNIIENHVGENGECQNNLILKQKDEDKVVEQRPANKSWASLFQKIQNNQEANGKANESLNDTTIKTDMSTDVILPEVNSSLKSNYDDPVYYRLGEFLAEHEIDHRTISLQPRGLINKSNYCYINSILQALLACPPVHNLLSGLSERITTNAKRKLTPVIYNMSKFVREFNHLPAAQRVSRRTDKNQKQDPNSLIDCDVPFEPHYIYKMLNGIRSDTFVVEGRQEDAEEFLGCLLNGLNDEMLELIKLVNKQGPKPSEIKMNNTDNDQDREWQEVTGKNKGCVTRRTELVHTPISDIFNGHLRSRVHRAGDKSTDNVQPFFTLQLNIEKASNVKEALEGLVCKNQLEGVTSSKTNEEVEAWQQVTIEDLPYVLILHLKCFDYKLDGCTKIIKALEFPIDLKIDGKLLSSKKDLSPKAKQYKLFAIVYHDGKEASKGHYLTDAYHVGYARWLRYDDASVKSVPEEQVLKPHGTRVPYLLFYRRSDSIRSK
ncbi:hypothetical protein Trydic_g809 [Trypoxylus dichotomus]